MTNSDCMSLVEPGRSARLPRMVSHMRETVDLALAALRAGAWLVVRSTAFILLFCTYLVVLLFFCGFADLTNAVIDRSSENVGRGLIQLGLAVAAVVVVFTAVAWERP